MTARNVERNKPTRFLIPAVFCSILVFASSLATAKAISYTATGAGGHVLWFADGTTQNNEFNPLGSFVEDYAAGTAVLSGNTYEANGIDGFAILANLSGYVPNSIPDSTADAPAGSPKIEADGSDSGNWHYYTTITGTLTGLGAFSGQDYTFVRYGPAFQVGFGANGKNSDYGASGWLTIFDSNGGEHRGDFNINLQSVPDTGTTALLLGISFGGLVVLRRRLV